MRSRVANFGVIKEWEQEGRKHVLIDPKKASYRGFPFETLGGYGRRKFENLIILTEPKAGIRIHYKT